jgi:threonine synthase
MRYISTRDSGAGFSASQAIIQGIAPDGGLFVPQEFPRMDMDEVLEEADEGYMPLAGHIVRPFLDEYSDSEVLDIVRGAYGEGFTHPDCAPVVRLDQERYVLELWHGPTLAFKDMALQMLPHLMSASRKKVGEKDRILILVATSGDTGKAALEGFSGVDGISIGVFYPHGGVSRAQELQMATHRGENVFVSSIRGNFDDTQTAVKRVFGDAAYAKEMRARGVKLSSANSINWGRLLPQIAYYFWAYARVVRDGGAKAGERINFVVPTGNFGNILAGYYAHRMGLPVNRLVCASNANNVLTEFFCSGNYNAKRPFFRTISPSMDILVSSNLERLLFELANRDGKRVRGWMDGLRASGGYRLDAPDMEKARALFWAGYCDDARTKDVIRAVFGDKGYLMDPHTAVAQAVFDDYRAQTGDTTPSVVVSTASPFKFSADVLGALGEAEEGDEFAAAEHLSRVSGLPVPEAIAGLRGLPVRFEEVLAPEGIGERMLRWAQTQVKG